MNQADPENIPRHVAVIMDGNGRWAKERGQERVYGHVNGVESMRKVIRAAMKWGVKYLTASRPRIGDVPGRKSMR